MTVKRTPVESLRRMHRGLVLRLLRDRGPRPRADLARELNLSATTMTKVVGQLLDEGVIGEAPAAAEGPRVGRPSTSVSIRPDAAYVLAAQVGAGAVQLGLCDLRARPKHLTSFSFDVESESPEQVIARLGKTAKALVRRAKLEPARLIGAGIAVPGPVDPAQRRNVLSINLGWKDVAFSDLLEPWLDAPVIVDHNVRSMALAEARYSSREDADSLMYVYVHTGVGAGVVMGGQPFRPGPYGVTELGHLRVIEKGRRCACGATGCLETVASEPYITEQVRLLGMSAGAAGSPLAALADAARAGDEAAAQVLADLVSHLTTGLASAVNLLNPALIVLGGMFDDAPDQVFDLIRTSLYAKAFPVLRDATRVVRSSLGSPTGVVGGAAIALEHLFYQ